MNYQEAIQQAEAEWHMKFQETMKSAPIEDIATISNDLQQELYETYQYIWELFQGRDIDITIPPK